MLLNVVLIDDEYHFRHSLKSSFPWKECGCQIVGDANNGISGYQLIESLHPDIAIVDINMPGMTGLELAEKVNALPHPCKCILLTGYGEFEYAKKAIAYGVKNYILKPVHFEELEKALNTLQMEIHSEKEHQSQWNQLLLWQKRQVLIDLVNGNIIESPDTLKNFFVGLSLNLSYPKLFVCMIKADSIETFEKKQEMIQQLLERQLLPGEAFLDSNNQICLVIGLQQESPQAAAAFLLDSLSEQLPGLKIAAGQSFDSLSQISVSYNQANFVLKTLSASKEAISFYQPSDRTRFSPCPELLKNQLLSGLSQKNESIIKSVLSQIFDLYQSTEVNSDTLIFLGMDLLSSITKISKSLLLPYSNENSTAQTITEQILSFSSFEEMHQWILSLCQNIVQQDTAREQNQISYKVKQLIEENYGDPSLSVDKIAKQCYLNYSYLCCRFKREENLTINEYLQQFRIQKAKELMSSQNQNITLIAERVGFDDANYFSKCFKKQLGITPSQYMKLLSEPAE